VITGSGAARTLSFTPVDDANGTVTITVTAQDDGGTADGGVDSFQRSFTISVTAVNDAPTLDAIADQVVLEDSGTTDVALTGIGPGPEEESTQTVTLVAVSSDPTIVPNPVITGAGAARTLSFTPIDDANGTVTTNTYDTRGRLTSQTVSPSSGTARTTSYVYDGVGQLINVTDPVGLTLTYVYDAAQDLRSVTDSLGNKVSYGYDVKGNRTSTNINDPDGTLVRTVQTVFDLRNRVSQINSAGSITDQLRNAVGQLTTETDPNRNPNTTHQYDSLGS
jgi:YD repeat-containing protein